MNTICFFPSLFVLTSGDPRKTTKNLTDAISASPNAALQNGPSQPSSVYRFYPDKPQQTQTILNESGRGENHYKEVVKRVSQRSVDVAIFTKEVDCVLKAVLFGVLSKYRSNRYLLSRAKRSVRRWQHWRCPVDWAYIASMKMWCCQM